MLFNSEATRAPLCGLVHNPLIEFFRSRRLSQRPSPTLATSSTGYVLALWALARAMAVLALSFAQLKTLAEGAGLHNISFPFLLA